MSEWQMHKDLINKFHYVYVNRLCFLSGKKENNNCSMRDEYSESEFKKMKRRKGTTGERVVVKW